MALHTTALVIAGNAVDTAIAFMQLHSGARGAAGTGNAVGTRVAVNGTVDAAGKITWTNVAFTGLAANQVVAEVSYWSAASGGTYYGGAATAGAAAANAAGAYTITSATETPSAA
jgi:hypothetical protein